MSFAFFKSRRDSSRHWKTRGEANKLYTRDPGLYWATKQCLTTTLCDDARLACVEYLLLRKHWFKHLAKQVGRIRKGKAMSVYFEWPA